MRETFYPDGRQGVDNQWVKEASSRITWQVSPRNKFAVFYDRVFKWRSHNMTAGADPDTGAQIHRVPLSLTDGVKWTSPLTSRLMFEAGYSGAYHHWYYIPPDERPLAEPFTAGWYAGAPKTDIGRSTNWNSVQESRIDPARHNFTASSSYITGSHTLKGGVQFAFGHYSAITKQNADLTQRYLNGVPDSVVVYNTPLFARRNMNADLAFYGQDSWTLKRLTVNYGMRVEHINTSIEETYSAVGRFVPARIFPRVVDMPDWTDMAPRVGAVYDLFGNAKTAVKIGVNRYNQSETTNFAQNYDPVRTQTAVLRWRDLSGDDIAQDTEIDFSTLPQNFGTARLNRPDPDIQRTYNWEQSIQVQHELLPRMSVSVAWFRRSFHDLTVSDNLLRSPSDYTPLTVVSPLNGEVITIYNLDPAKVSQVDVLDTNTIADSDRRSQVYKGLEFGVSARLPGGGAIFGGYTFDRTTYVLCDSPDDPNTLRFCDGGTNDVPMQQQIKVNLAYPTVWGLHVGAAVISNNGGAAGAGSPGTQSYATSNWRLSRTTRYAADCPGPCVPGALVVPNLTEAQLLVPLAAPGTQYLERSTQVDLNLGKGFTLGRTKLLAKVEMFNALGAAPILSVRTSDFGTATYMQPAQTLQPRILRIGAQINW